VSLGKRAISPLLNPSQHIRANQIKKTIRIAARRTPWLSNCFTQALAARFLLGLYRIPYALYFGFSRNSKTNEFMAHAWIVSGKVNVTGGNGFCHFVIISTFISPKALVRTGIDKN
jgi:hypothetical protein